MLEHANWQSTGVPPGVVAIFTCIGGYNRRHCWPPATNHVDPSVDRLQVRRSPEQMRNSVLADLRFSGVAQATNGDCGAKFCGFQPCEAVIASGFSCKGFVHPLPVQLMYQIR